MAVFTRGGPSPTVAYAIETPSNALQKRMLCAGRAARASCVFGFTPSASIARSKVAKPASPLCQPASGMVWSPWKPSGGEAPSMLAGTSLPAALAAAASSRTQSEPDAACDHSTTTAAAAASSCSMRREKFSPPASELSHQTEQPCASSHAASAAAASRSVRA